LSSMGNKKNQSLQDCSILVLEDEQLLLLAIQKKLRLNGFDVVTARTVNQGMEYLQEIGDFDVLWLDHYLIGPKNGLDFVFELKKKGSIWKDIPIFVISNTAGPNEVEEYLKLGIIRHYVKAEWKLQDIIDDIRRYLSFKKLSCFH